MQHGRPWTTRRIFLSTPSARRATEALKHPGVHGIISIHALREEGDRIPFMVSIAAEYFYPRPPRGGRLTPSGIKPKAVQFLSTPSARRATGYTIPRKRNLLFLSTPSARRATWG